MEGTRVVKALGLWLLLALSPLCLAQGPAPDAPSDDAPRPALLAEAEIPQVNVNHDDAAVIAEGLDGVGMARAEAIVRWREEHGAFSSLEELTEVSGIGEVTVQRNRDKIRFD